MNSTRSITDALSDIAGLHGGSELPTVERLDSIRGLVTGSLKPVRPLPSNGALIWFAIAIFIAFSTLAAALLGFAGFQHLSAYQKLAYYTVILLSAAFLSAALVSEIIPGSHRLLPFSLVIIAPLFLLTLTGWLLFPRLDFNHFTKLGLACLKLGTACAAASGLLGYFVVRRGFSFSTSPVRTTTIAGLLAGLAGFAVLALRCPVQSIAHIFVWHLGAVIIAGAAGALIGLWRTARSPLPRNSKV